MNMTSETTGKIAEALAKACLPNPQKTKTVLVTHKTGGRHKFSYAPLDEIIHTVREPLSKAGLSAPQIVTQEDGKNILITRLMHTSGEWIQSTYPLPIGLDAQAMGSAITYARRYALCSILGIAAEDDDDGNAATTAEEDAEAAAAEQKKAEARARMDELAKKGLLTDANTGKKIEPGHVPEPQTDHSADLEPKKPAADVHAGIAPTLVALMKRDGITADTLTKFSLAAKHFKQATTPAEYPADYVAAITKDANWAKVTAYAKKEKEGAK